MKKNKENNLDELINNLNPTDNFGLFGYSFRLEVIKAIVDFLNRIIDFLDVIDRRLKAIKNRKIRKDKTMSRKISKCFKRFIL